MNPKKSYSCFVCSKYFNGDSEVVFLDKDCVHGADIEISQDVYLQHINSIDKDKGV